MRTIGKEEDAGKSFLFFIDEAELHLHPTAQRKLKDVLLLLSKELDQVFINTHSSVFVADEHPTPENLQSRKEGSITSFKAIDALDKPYVVFELLGGSPSDLLLPRNFLVVEGPSEVELLTRVIKRFYLDKPIIQVISAEGDTHQAKRSINAIRKSFKPLGRSIFEKKIVVLCDAPTPKAQAGFDAFLKEFKAFKDRGQIKMLGNGSLEESYPNNSDWKRTEQQVSDMSGKQKIKLSKQVGDEITKEQFENDMKSVYEALVSTWEFAF
ncbi:MAG: AAA family ATPase [Halioglobus sp.]